MVVFLHLTVHTVICDASHIVKYAGIYVRSPKKGSQYFSLLVVLGSINPTSSACGFRVIMHPIVH